MSTTVHQGPLALGRSLLRSHTRFMHLRLAPDAVTQVLLVDPDVSVLAGLTMVLNEAPNIHVIATATDRTSALAAIDVQTDATIVIARRFPNDDGYRICRALKARAPRARCVIHSAASIDEHDVLRSGCTAVVLKQLNSDDLIRTITDLSSRDLSSRDLSARDLSAQPPPS